MELIEFLKLIKNKKKQLLLWWLSVAVLGTAAFCLIPRKDIAVLSLDIARQASDRKEIIYEYDQFYRLEADDRFANTLVQWSRDPNARRLISQKAAGQMPPENIELATESLRAEKRSASLVQVRFAVESQEDAAVFAKAVYEVFVQKTRSLNEGQQQDWFKIIGSGPTVQSTSFSPALVAAAMAVLGLLAGISAVLLGNYLNGEKKQNEDRN